jgi:hypothetical protein
MGKTFAERGDCFALRARNDTPCCRLPGVFPESKLQSLFHRQRAAAVPDPLELPGIHVLAQHVHLRPGRGVSLFDHSFSASTTASSTVQLEDKTGYNAAIPPNQSYIPFITGADIGAVKKTTTECRTPLA